MREGGRDKRRGEVVGREEGIIGGLDYMSNDYTHYHSPI